MLQNFQRWLILLVMLLNTVLKTVILHKPHGDDKYLDPAQVFRLFVIAAFEYMCLLAGYLSILFWHIPGRRAMALPASRWRCYLALSFPEVTKTVAIVLQLFDCEPSMLLLLGLLIVSIQHYSLQSVTRLSSTWLAWGSIVALALKLFIRWRFHSTKEIWDMGIIL